jgi:hypothetical protein
MKKFIIAVVLIVVSTAAHSQMFNGFIDGAGLGYVNEVVPFLENKGYEQIKNKKYSNLIFMLGHIDGVNVLIMITRKDEDSTDIKKITLFYPPSKNAPKDYSHHRKQFMKAFGVPTGISKTSSYWAGLGTDDQDNLVYTIGVDDGHIYHSLERKD